MNPNELFNFIGMMNLNSKETKVNFSTCKKINKTKNTEEENYIRFDLKRGNMDAICDNESSYSLQEHHISFYEESRKGQYHYTAYFMDKESKRYRLHVYFDEYDELIEKFPIEFSVYDDETANFKNIACDNLNEKFINLANNNTESIMLKLRESHVRAIEDLIDDYNSQEQESSLLSEKKNSKVDYLKSLKSTKAILEKLLILREDPYYHKVKQLIECSISYLEKSIELTPTKKKKKSSVRSEEKEGNSVTKKPVSSLNTPSSLQANQKKIEPALDNRLEKEIDLLIQTFSTLDKMSTKMKIVFLEDTFSKFHQIVLTINEDEKLLFLTKKTTTLYNRLYKAGGELLCDLLTIKEIEDRFDLASQLVSFHEGLNVNLLGMALQAGEPELLDFILRHKKFPINALSFTFKDSPQSVPDVYRSAVHFCYKNDYDYMDEHKSMIECLSVLIKHGASTLVVDDSGLPIAHIILSTLNHPLQKAFENNMEQTLNSKQFRGKLIKLLNNYMEKNILVEAEIKSIKKAISTYKQNSSQGMHSFFGVRNPEIALSGNNVEHSINNSIQ